MDIKQQMQKAKLYIQQEKYLEAIEILKPIDHPVAKQWIQVCLKKSSKTTPKQFLKKNAAVLVGIIALVIGVVGGFMFGRAYTMAFGSAQVRSEDAELTTAVAAICIEDGRLSITECYDYAELMIRNYYLDTLECGVDYGQNTNLTPPDFMNCLRNISSD